MRFYTIVCMFQCFYQTLGEDILASLRELEDALSDIGPVERPEGQTQNSSLHQESLYYLNTYGTHLALISYYMRHDCMTEALTYLLNKVGLELLDLQDVNYDTLNPYSECLNQHLC